MSGKQKRPCVVCGRGMAIHRGKRKVCSTACKNALKAEIRRQKLRADDPRRPNG